MIRAVLFDLDDTLNDRGRSWLVFLESLASSTDGYLGPCTLPDVHRAVVLADRGGYRPKHELFEELRTSLPWRRPLSAVEIEEIWRDGFPRSIVTREGAIGVLTELKARGMGVGVVTNGRVDSQEAKIARMGIGPLLDAVVISERVGVKKPDPRIFIAALDVLDVLPRESVFVGDNPELDVVGPSQLGMKTMWLANGRSWPGEYPAPDETITHFEGICALLEAPNRRWV